jgi:predicted nucleic acid-binding protein
VRVLYAETSAVLGWLLGEEDPLRPRAFIDSADKVVTSVLTLVEASRGILRAENEGRIATADAFRLRGILARAVSGWDLMEVTAQIREKAAEAFPIEPVRTLDAVHLATALEFAKVHEEISVLSFDERILANLQPLGLASAAPEA